MDFLVDGDRRFLPLKNGYFIQEGTTEKPIDASYFMGLLVSVEVSYMGPWFVA
jgi:uncharacterized membrane-anchored protein